ncbi:MAG: bestrophin family ion channel [Bacteroidota bacterium]
MYVGKHLRFKVVLLFSWKSVLVFTIYASLIFLALYVLLPRFDGLPFAIVSVTGIAVAFYVGFKNNSSYERLWEARKIWGSYVNSSRTFAMYVIDFLHESEHVNTAEIMHFRQRIVKRHIAYLSAVRFQLRKQTVWKMEEVGNRIVSSDTNFTLEKLDQELSKYMEDEEVDYVIEQNNPAVHIIKKQSEDLQNLYMRGCLSEIHHVEITKMLADFYNQQGACERIKGYPFPRQYAYYSKLFVYLLIAILPFSIYSELSKLNERITWMTIPIAVTLSWIFYTMEVVGDSSENPFENAINDVPITAISRTIEIDLLQMLKETDIPEKIRSENNILM